MTTQQVLVRLPEDLARRFRRRVPARSRSAFLQTLLEQALVPDIDDSDPLYLAALAVEQDAQLAAEALEWDGLAGDGLTGEPTAPSPRR